ncbi:hypothetical protein ACFQ22_04750 [Lentilactobacillus raoultii]|uniref:Surface layer protein A domain-containing protein n=1 Tax=Lentilactobacillus raoultii TaxID=1987503 RepID=A0ABW3PG86_9LACO|nr:hypothetical protein [Lentilactobacillus raoultii]
MKKNLLIDAGLLCLIPLGIIGFSVSSDTQPETARMTTAHHNKVAAATDTEYFKGTRLHSDQIQTLDFSPSRVYRIKYYKTNFRTTLDDGYREEKLYRYVPGGKKNNRTYSWRQIKAKVGKRVYVDMKAKAYYRDDDGERESEDFYRIRVAKSASAQKYWVNEDVLEDD